MKPQILPKEILNNSVIIHQFILSKKKQTIYGLLLFIIISGLASLPFIYVDVYSSANGIVKPDKERLSLQPLNSGRVIFSNIKSHAKVKKGDTLLILESQQVKERERLIIEKYVEKEKMISDLNSLLNPSEGNLSTAKYLSEKALFDQQLFDLKVKLNKTTHDLNRSQKLFQKNVIAAIEIEKVQYDFDLAQNNLTEFKKRFFAKWENELNQERNKLAELKSQLKQFKESQAEYILLAPDNGSLINAKGFQPNAFVMAGQPLAEISPEANLVINCYVNPKDIGYLKINTPAKFQIDAYNYNQWGWATGEIKTIGSDIELIQNQPVFQVQCSLNENELYLKNGVAGKLKKGMTVKAQFFRARRSLWELLFDKAEDWFNPMKSNSNQT